MTTKDNLNNILKNIIERKHNELGLGRDYSSIFSKIKDFEANAIGQIGEEYVRKICKDITNIEQDDNDTVHNEFDISTKNGLKIEIKTARFGKKGTFQFNGIEPRRNYNYILCLGICLDRVVYRIFSHDDIKYVHSVRKYYIEQGDDFKKQLVQMNPDNLVSYKLTTNLKQMIEIDYLPEELNKICKS
ncbi:MAG: hypothetical protein Q4Q06_01390, partial [Bacteroidota bacterium]|nr:hypothetical protein [Bacteroidota bacterium]